MEFSELNDEIGADDWLIPRGEISRKRLIKETPRYSIYKADWFGDVLVYEPKVRAQGKKTCTRSQCKLVSDGNLVKETNDANNHQEQIDQYNDQMSKLVPATSRKAFKQLNIRLDACLDASLASPTDGQLGPMSPRFTANKTVCPSSPTSSLCSDTESLESGYSSISSTPQYNRMRPLRSEFEFPSRASSTWASMSSLATDEEPDEECSGNDGEAAVATVAGRQLGEQPSQVECCCREEEQPGKRASKLKCRPPTTFPVVVLNRDSFNFVPAEQEGPEVDKSEQEEAVDNYSNYRLPAAGGLCMGPTLNDDYEMDHHGAMVAQLRGPEEGALKREENWCLENLSSQETRNDDKKSAAAAVVDDNESSSCVHESSWFELNELRLIAHENFMLFMGACMEPVSFNECTSNQSTALVMQMSHPKASSLYNLLHASNNSTASTLCSPDR